MITTSSFCAGTSPEAGARRSRKPGYGCQLQADAGDFSGALPINYKEKALLSFSEIVFLSRVGRRRLEVGHDELRRLGWHPCEHLDPTGGCLFHLTHARACESEDKDGACRQYFVSIRTSTRQHTEAGTLGEPRLGGQTSVAVVSTARRTLVPVGMLRSGRGAAVIGRVRKYLEARRELG